MHQKKEVHYMKSSSWRKRLGVCVVLVSFLMGPASVAFSDSPTVTTFDVPGAAFGTHPQTINAEGAIAGYYLDASFTRRAFVRDKHGAITPFDTPGPILPNSIV